MDVSVRSGGVVAGVGNTIASLASYVGPLLVAWLLESYRSWGLVFVSVALANVLAASAFATLSTATPIDADGEKDK